MCNGARSFGRCYNHVQGIWYQPRELRKAGQPQRTLISAFEYFLIATASTWSGQ